MRSILLAAALATLPPTAFAAVLHVTIVDYAFVPALITVRPGDAVVWTNTDTVPHTVAALDGSFGSGALPPGGRFRQVFSHPGRFTYRCGIHPEMQGTVVVSPPG